MSNGPFEKANVAVVESAFDQVEWTQTATNASATQARPALASDGINLRGSSRGVVVAEAPAGQTIDIEVFAYFADIDQWAHIVEADRAAVDEYSNTWKLNTGGADRIYVRISAITGGTTANMWFGRSYV